MHIFELLPNFTKTLRPEGKTDRLKNLILEKNSYLSSRTATTRATKNWKTLIKSFDLKY